MTASQKSILLTKLFRTINHLNEIYYAMTYARAAKELGVNERTVRRWASEEFGFWNGNYPCDENCKKIEQFLVKYSFKR